MRLYKLINPNKDLTFSDFQQEAEEFIQKFCHYNSIQQEWPDNYTLNDITRHGYTWWISFKRSLATFHPALIELIIKSDPSNQRINNMIGMIIQSYSYIDNFIISHFPCKDFIRKWHQDDISFEGKWDRVDIAIELNKVISDILAKIAKIDSGLVEHNRVPVTNEPQKVTFPEIKDSRLSLIFLRLLDSGYVEMSTDCGKYRWIGDNGLYGYFVDTVTQYLKIRNDSGRIPWKYFEGIIENHESILTTARDRVSKYNNLTLPKPDGYMTIYDIITAS